MTPLFEAFERVARLRADAPAVVSAGSELTYGALLQAASALGDRLRECGVGPGSAVALVLRNDSAFLVGALGCASVGAAYIPVDGSLRAAEVQACGDVVPFDVVLAASGVALHSPLDRLPRLMLDARGGVVSVSAQASSCSLAADVACVELTSGSTGRPKAIVLSATATFARPEFIRCALELSGEDRTLCCVPLSHAHGLDCLALPTLLGGGALHVMEPAFAFPARVMSVIEQRRITFISVLPDFYAKLLELPGGDVSSLRLPFCGSAALSPEVARRFEARFGARIHQGYGVAEVNVISLNVPEAGVPFEYGSVGKPLPGVETKLGEAEGGGRELWIRSTALASGYLSAAAEDQARFVDGWFATGDLVRHDEQGRLFIVGRRSTMIHVGGQRVSPLAVEAVLSAHQALAEVCVTGAPDGRGGEVVVAHVVARPENQVTRDVLEREMLAQARAVLSDAAVPSRIIWWARLPKSPLGKVLRAQVAARVEP